MENEIVGGEGTGATPVVKPKRVVSEETKAKMRAAKVGKPSPMKGKTMPESAKEAIRQARLGKHFTRKPKAA